MAYTALVSLGPTIGIGITSVKLYQCGDGCTSCTPITNYTNVPVSSFNSPGLLVTGITTGSTCIKAEPIGACSGTTQCIVVSGIPAPTPTPSPSATTPGATPTPSPSATPTPSPSATTPGSTPGPTPTVTAPMATPTPSATALPGCGSTISGTYAPSNYTIQTQQLNLSTATNGNIITVSYVANDRPNKFAIYGNGFEVATSLWAGSDPAMGTTYTGPWSGNPIDSDGTGSFTFTYASGTSYELRVEVGGANPNASPTPNPSDAWSVTISCSPAPTSTPSPTPTPTSAPLYGYFRSTGLSNYTSLCQSPGYVTTALWYSTGTTFSSAIAYTRVYSDTSYTPFNGGSLWYAVTQDDTFNTLTGGQFNAVQIDADGYIISTVLYNCSGGGGAGSGGQT